jgi:4'-phosphopantetheinyl transferase EntD
MTTVHQWSKRYATASSELQPKRDGARAMDVAANNPIRCRSMTLSLATLLPAGIAVVQAGESVPLDTLLVEERAMVVAATPKRMLEFATGRWCARKALREKGIEGFPVLADANRAPVWPRGIVGSITHTEGFYAAAIGRRDSFAGIGIDAEIDGRVGRELWSDLFTIEEIDGLELLSEPKRASMATVMFSAKESFYKAQYSFTNAWLDFTSAAVSIEGDRWHLQLVNPRSAFARLQQPISGRFAIYDQRVLTAIAIRPSQVPFRTDR